MRPPLADPTAFHYSAPSCSVSYELHDLEGNSITKPEARALAEQWKVTEEVRKRLRNKKTLAQERWEAPPSVTSEPKAPRNGRPSQPADPNPERLSVTTDQLKMLVFKSLEQMLNSARWT